MTINLELSKLLKTVRKNNIKYFMFFITLFLSFKFSVFGLTTDGNGVYQIETKEDLFEFAQIVNATHETIEQNQGAHATLLEDIDIIDSQEDIDILLNIIKHEEEVEDSEIDKLKNSEWIPIGNNIQNSYTGTFDGQNKKIRYIYCDISNKEKNAAGLFGFIGVGGRIKNINISDVYIKTRKGTEANYVGSICGYSDAGDISECSCENAKVSSIDGYFGNYSGGICGYNIGMGRIIECTINKVDVISINGNGNNYSGGICGYNAGRLITCFAGIRNLLSQNGKYYNDKGDICGANINDVIECYYLKDQDNQDNNIKN